MLKTIFTISSIATILNVIDDKTDQATQCTCESFEWSYNLFPKDKNGNTCIGGCGGKKFQIQYFQTSIKRIQVWTKEEAFESLIFTFFNGFSNSYGKEVEHDDKEHAIFEFKKGEVLKGDILIGTTAGGDQVGQLKLQTSTGRTFEVGRPTATVQSQPAHNSFLAGFFGSAGASVDRMGPILYKPFKHSVVKDITWPTLDVDAGELKPLNKDVNLCNDTKEAKSEHQNFDRNRGDRRSMAFDSPFDLEDMVPINCEVPELVKSEKEKGGQTWQLGRRRATQAETNNQDLIKENVPTKVDAMTQTQGNFKWVEGTISGLPFTAKYLVTFEDDTTHEFKIDGYLDQLSVSPLEKVEVNTKLKDGETCTLIHLNNTMDDEHELKFESPKSATGDFDEVIMRKYKQLMAE